jgi:hypothetical protein
MKSPILRDTMNDKEKIDLSNSCWKTLKYLMKTLIL